MERRVVKSTLAGDGGAGCRSAGHFALPLLVLARLIVGLALLGFVQVVPAAEPFRCPGGVDCFYAGEPLTQANNTDWGIGASNIFLDGLTRYYRVSFFDTAAGGTRIISALYTLNYSG